MVKIPAGEIDRRGFSMYTQNISKREEQEMFAVSFGAGEFETQFATKGQAIEWARKKELESFEVLDSNDTVVYQEFPEIKFV